MNISFKKIIFYIASFFIFCVSPIQAQEVVKDDHKTVLSEVINIVNEEEKLILGTGTYTTVQKIESKIIEGEQKGKIISFENDYIKLKEGQKFYLNIINTSDNITYYSVSEPYRLPSLIFFVLLFFIVVFAFGGRQGVRGLVSLGVSVFVIFYFLLPQILDGGNPVAISLLASSFIIILGSYITHGFNKTTTTAVVGMIATIVTTGLLAYIAVKTSYLSGFSSDEAVYLNFNTGGTLNFQGLLFGGILIGLLGILYDAAISQAVIVEELYNTNKLLSKKIIYKKAIRIGREHIGALVDTLAIAYVGASLPLFLFFFSGNEVSFLNTINREIFATEIIRIIIGSIGVIMTVPITTFISTLLIVKKPEDGYKPENEEESIRHHHHH